MKNLAILLFLIISIIGCQTNEKANFEKIIYHTSSCFGNCPTYHLEIDNKKNIKLFAETVYKKNLVGSFKDSTKMGYFYGTANSTSFSKLNETISKIGMDTLKFDNQTCCDESIRTIILYHNGKRKYMKSMFPPEGAYQLIDILDEICKTCNLIRTKDKFTLEN